MCDKSAPCKTITFAHGQLGATRNVIRIVGGQFSLGTSTVTLSDSEIIDGDNTMVSSSAIPVFRTIGSATLEGVRLSSVAFDMPVVLVAAGGAQRLASASVETGELRVEAGGALEITGVTVRNGSLDCTNGMLTVHRTVWESSEVDTSSCRVDLAASKLTPAPGGAIARLRFAGGLLTIENNVFIGTDEASTLLFILGAAAGSRFAFNTIYNTSSATGSAFALGCEDGLDVTSNIFAYRSTKPIACVARNSLFDAQGVGEVGRGSGNVSADVATVFRSTANLDLHLSATSPARAVGEPSSVIDDFDGNVRPMPAGSLPDVGAYEAPN